MDKQLHRLDTLQARDPQGALHTVHAYEHLVRLPVGADPFGQWEPTGHIEFRLASGQRLDMPQDDVFVVPDSGLRLTRVSDNETAREPAAA
ncbi:hypothetical protein [uncultured Aquabacterium sp.]|uniref:hypothetical protein n=1 Tax=Aquabacterium sp. TaxID=1872578 RepID=UPI0025DD19E3|nr:hypothetical protein [uncultured Aquabacterium sp.]